MKKPKPWDRPLWGVEFSTSNMERPLLIGTSWDRDAIRPGHFGEPTRPLLFTSRRDARAWCANKVRLTNGGRSVPAHWRFTPVRVRETVTVRVLA